jgi:membrane-associated protease RseP (regulator of RpoE activity)
MPQVTFSDQAVIDNKKRRFGSKIFVVCCAAVLVFGFGAWAVYKWVASRPIAIDSKGSPQQSVSSLKQQDVSSSPPQTKMSPQPQKRDRVKPPAKSPNLSGRVTRSWIGVNMQAVPSDIANKVGMTTPSGVFVIACEPGGPAHRAGILPDDVILEMNGTRLSSPSDLRERIIHVPAGAPVQLKVWRNGQAYRATVWVAEMPTNLESRKHSEARKYASSYDTCFARFCPGCSSPLDLFKEQTHQCKNCEIIYKRQIDDCSTTAMRN